MGEGGSGRIWKGDEYDHTTIDNSQRVNNNIKVPNPLFDTIGLQTPLFL